MNTASVCSLAVAMAASAASADVTSTWDVGSGGNGHTYVLVAAPGGINWNDAEAAAEARGGTLATITSSAENLFVYNSLGIGTNNAVWHVDSFNSQIGPWLGAFQPAGSPEPSGGYQWVTGEAFSYTAFFGGEPNNSGGTENRICYFGNPSRTSNWNDITDTVLIEGYVIEFVPAPSAIGVLGLAGLAGLRRTRR